MNLLTRSQKDNNSVTSHRTDARLLCAAVVKLALGFTLIALFPLAPRASADSFVTTFFSRASDGKNLNAIASSVLGGPETGQLTTSFSPVHGH